MSIRIRHIDEIFDELVTHFKQSSLLPIIGAGVTTGEATGHGYVPSGSEYRLHMLDELKKANFSFDELETLRNLSFSSMCEIYEDDENVSSETRRSYLRTNFCNVKLSEAKRKLLNLNWPYIYTLNIDDAIEKNSEFNKVILPKRPVQEEIFNEEKCVIKLHGDIWEILTYNDSTKVFTSKEYSTSVYSNNVLLKKLRHDYAYMNIIFIGCSLSDEFDLKSADIIINNKSDQKELSKIYYCTTAVPNSIVKSQLKTFGVTDIVIFENYNQLYEKITEAGKEAKKINKSELTKFQSIPVRKLSQKDDLNSEMFYFGLSIFDLNESTLNFPYFFIERELKDVFLKNLSNNCIHFIFGNRISGKTYFLVNLFDSIKDREIYYFNSAVQLNSKAFKELLSRKDIVVFFDTNVLSREQFEDLLTKSPIIKNNNSNYVIAINNNDSDIKGIIKWKLKNGDITPKDIHNYRLNNKFSIAETKSINALLPYCKIPVFKNKHTVLDNLMQAETIMNKKYSRFKSSKLFIDKIEELIFYIALATKNKLYSTEINRFDLVDIVTDITRKYSPFIERIEASIFEKDGSYSPIKYVLNAKYWLYRELGNYASNKNNFDKIVKSYKYIVQKQIESTGKVTLKIRKHCRDYIMFDTINQIFMNENNGQLLLSEKIYDGLHELLAQNYHYLHQYSKCCLRLCYSMKEKTKKLHYINKGLEMAKVAASMVEAEYEKSPNENLLITLAHVEYSIATMAGELCCLNNFMNGNDISYAVDYSSKALYSIYNKDDYLRDKQNNRRGILKFLDKLSDVSFRFDNKTKRQTENLLNYLINLK